MSALETARTRFSAALERALPPASAHPARLHSAMRYAAEGGKRLRALLVYAAGEAASAAPEALDAPAVAVELIHAYSLVHDDLPAMDDDALRRGRPTVHKAYDEATAILAGDGLHTLAFEVLMDEAFAPAEAAVRLNWARALAMGTGSRGMTGGQAVDLESEGQQLSLSALQSLHRLKTGALIVAAVRMGLSAGEADAASWQAVDDYAHALGLAYQIQDDVLDVEGSAESLGKTPGKDGLAEKSTYVRLMGLAAAKASAAQLFAQAQASLLPLGARGDFLNLLLQKIQTRSS